MTNNEVRSRVADIRRRHNDRVAENWTEIEDMSAVTDVDFLLELAEGACSRPAIPEVVCLCGSTRFMDAFHDEGWRLTLEGKIVLSVGVSKYADKDGGHAGEMMGQEVADALDELHFRKIDLCDRVLVLNVGGYIGESTAAEIAHAEKIGRPIDYLEREPCETCGGERVVLASPDLHPDAFKLGSGAWWRPCPTCQKGAS